MSAFQNCLNVAKHLIRSHPYRYIINSRSVRLIQSMHQFKLNTVIKYPKREIPNENQTEKSLLEQRNIHQTSTRWAERKNYYHILGVRKHATSQEIKKAYYLLAKKYHPDSSKLFTSPENARKFQEISEAYRVLSDDNKRLEYDLYGVVKSAKKSLPDAKGGDGDRKLHKMFDEVGYARKSTDFDPPIPIEIPEEVTLKLSFLQSIRGATKDVTIKMAKKCPSCSGAIGDQFKKNLVTCPKCNGSGVQAITTKAHMVRGPCKFCKGHRYILQNTCADCTGQGVIYANKTVDVNIPPGVNSGDIIRVPHPNKVQNIAIRISVAPSDEFSRVGNDIFSDLPISLSQAVLGGTIKIKCVDGNDYDVTLQPGTEVNTKIRLAGKGVKTNSGVGDHIVTIKVKVPKVLTAKQRALMTAFAELEAEEPDLRAELRKNKIRDELEDLHNLKGNDKASKTKSFVPKQKLSHSSSSDQDSSR